MRRALTVFLVIGYSCLVSGQIDCGGFFPFGEMTKLEYAHYDKKNDLSSKTVHRIIAINESDNGYQADIEMLTFNKINELTLKSSYKANCRDSLLGKRVVVQLAPELTNAFSSFKYSIEGNQVKIPAELIVGQELSGANDLVSASYEGAKLPPFKYEISSHKVEKLEALNTILGAQDCYKVTYQLNIKAIFSRMLTVSEWYLKEFGLVKSEVYNQKGLLLHRTVLSKFEK